MNKAIIDVDKLAGFLSEGMKTKFSCDQCSLVARCERENTNISMTHLRCAEFLIDYCIVGKVNNDE